MRAVIIYRKNTDYEREVTDFVRDFGRRTGKVIDEMDPDSREGEAFSIAHDVVEYPTVMGLSDDGKVLAEWRGTPLPRIDEVSYYAENGGFSGTEL